MDKFIYCFDEDSKSKLEQQGYRLIKPVKMNNQKGYVFENMINKNVNFDLTKVMFSNRMNF